MTRPLRVLCLAVVGLAAVAAQAAAFGTITTAGQNAEHERMTRHALACPAGSRSTGICFEASSIDQLAGGPGATGAVGYPDVSTYLNDESYHCDGGDWYPVAGYPQSAAAARAAIDRCRAVIDSRLDQAVAGAARLLGPKDEILAAQVGLSPSCTFVGGVGGRAKCDVLGSLGIALHVAQDFYAHSNWADRPDPSRVVSPENPDGFGRASRAPYLDVRGSPAFPTGLVSGCFGMPQGLTCNYGGRFGFALSRVKHLNLNKDGGTIDPALGAGNSPRGRVAGNFARAVTAAMDDSVDKWATLRERLVTTYQPKKAALMICALVRDDPVRDCQGRVVALAIDSSGSNTTNDPAGLRKSSAASVALGLTSRADAGPTGTVDQLAVVDFDDSASVVYPLGDPDGAGAAIGGVDSSGGTFIAGGITTALGAMAATGPPAGKSGIVVLTDGEDSNITALVDAIGRAISQGVRVSFGFLSPPSSITQHSLARRQMAVTPELQKAIIASGGVFATIATAADQQTFTDLVQRRGLTALDDPDGADDGGAIALGVTVSGSISAKGDIDTWTYAASPGEGVKVTLTPPASVFQAAEVRDDDGRVTAAGSRPAGAAVTLRGRATKGGGLRVSVGGDPGVYTLKIESDAGAPRLPKAVLPRLAQPAITVLGAARISMSPTGRPIARTIRRGRGAYIVWRLRSPHASKVSLEIRGPRGFRKTIHGSVARRQSYLRARLGIVGRRQGAWTFALAAGSRVIWTGGVRTR